MLLHLIQPNGQSSGHFSNLTNEEIYNNYRRMIPKGIYFEKAKKRWRVRLYKNGVVIFRAYFKDFNQAYEAYNIGNTEQRLSVIKPKNSLNISTRDTTSLLQAIQLL